jgi:signal transduction histidine kinase
VEFDFGTSTFGAVASRNLNPRFIGRWRSIRFDPQDPLIREVLDGLRPVQIPDLLKSKPFFVRDAVLDAGFRAMLAVPIVQERVARGLALFRRAPGAFDAGAVELLTQLAHQAAVAIGNAALFRTVQTQQRELEIANRAKSQFLANMSHELRTPMNAILGYTGLVLDGSYGAVPEKVRASLQRVERNGRHLLGLINEVLDLSKIEAGQLELDLVEYSLAEVIQSVVASVEGLAREKGLALSASVAPGLPRGRADERRIAQVLLNLVGNAIKFTDAGEVELRAAADGERFTVAVRDTGPGIDPGNQDRIFEEFQQADASSTRTKGGTGLGLAIARRIVELHGGRLWVESQPGSGSTFSFAIPIRVEPASAGTPARRERIS